MKKPYYVRSSVVKVSVIIPVKDEEDGLRFLVEDFENSTFKEQYEIDFIFVIDGRTNDGSKVCKTTFGHNNRPKRNPWEGAAIQQAVKFWKENPTPYAVFWTLTDHTLLNQLG